MACYFFFSAPGGGHKCQYHVGCEKCSAQIQHESVRWAGLNMGQLHGHYSPAKWRLPCYCCWAFRGCGYLSLNTKKWRYVLDNVKQQNFLSHGIPLHLLGCGSGPSNSPSMTILTMSFGYLAPGVSSTILVFYQIHPKFNLWVINVVWLVCLF